MALLFVLMGQGGAWLQNTGVSLLVACFDEGWLLLTGMQMQPRGLGHDGWLGCAEAAVQNAASVGIASAQQLHRGRRCCCISILMLKSRLPAEG